MTVNFIMSGGNLYVLQYLQNFTKLYRSQCISDQFKGNALFQSTSAQRTSFHTSWNKQTFIHSALIIFIACQDINLYSVKNSEI